MSEAEADIDDVDALLSEVLAADMALLRHVNAQALAATEPDVLNGYVRSQQRLARSVRTTLTTKARLAREAAEAARRTALPEPQPRDTGWTGPAREQQEMEAAVEARVRREYDPAEADEIDPDLGLLVEAIREDEGYANLSRDDKIEVVMTLVRARFGPPKAATPPVTRPAAAPEPADREPPPAAPPAAAPAAEPEPGPAPPPPAEEGYVPPWERRPPNAFDRGGGGSGW